MLGCWILAVPPNAGPDEPAHAVASAALVRGETTGAVDPALPGIELFEVPGMVGLPPHACYALQPTQPVTCVLPATLSTDPWIAGTTSANYPPAGLILPGLASFVPSAGAYQYLARALSAAVMVALVSWCLVVAARRSTTMAAAMLLGLTPIAWFSGAVINPSAMAIAGGLALWTGLLLMDSGRAATVTVVAGWAALLLARRDGPVWATWIVVFVCLLGSCRPSDVWRRLDTWGRWVVLALVPLPALHTLTVPAQRSQLFLGLAPLALLGLDLILRSRSSAARVPRLVWPLAALAALAVGFVVIDRLRPGGFDADQLAVVINTSGEHLRQIVGVLGSLDAPTPTSAIILWWVVIGVLGGVALTARPRAAAWGAGVIGAALVTAWVLELGSGDTSGTYWQGRYSMPLVVGLPIVLALGAEVARRPPRFAAVLAGASWFVTVAAFWSAQRRWAVGIDGPVAPWRWNTWGSPLPPIVVSAVFSVVMALLAWWTAGRPRPFSRRD